MLTVVCGYTWLEDICIDVAGFVKKCGCVDEFVQIDPVGLVHEGISSAEGGLSVRSGHAATVHLNKG